MLYRIHRPHNPNGNYGTLLGYVHLCHGHIDINHIHENLLRTKVITEQWFTPEELQAVAAPAHIYGLYAYTVLRKPPHARTHLFYLYPVESKAEQSQPINNWTSIPSFTSSTTGYTFTFNPTSNYIVSSPYVPISIPLTTTRTISQNIAQEIDQEIFDELDAAIAPNEH